MALWYLRKTLSHLMLLIIHRKNLRETHNYELTESDSVVFCVDYALNGIGSNSCSPVVLDPVPI